MRMERLGTPLPLTADLVGDRPFTFGQVGGLVHATLTLEPGGRIAGSRHPNERTWQIDPQGDLLFLDDGGRVTTRFHELAVPNGQLVLLGEFLDSGIVHFLSTPALGGDPPEPSLPDAGHDHPQPDELTAPIWGLGRLGAGVVTDLFVLADGRLQGSMGPNETRWVFGEDGSLVFLGAGGEPTTRFTTLIPTSRGHAWLGPFVDGRTIHYLVPTVDPGDPDWLPPFAASLIDQQRAVSEPWGALRPPLLARDRYVGARRHLFSLASGEVIGGRRGGDDGRHAGSLNGSTSARIDEVRQVFDEVVTEVELDPRALFWFSIKGSDAVALYDYIRENRPRTCLQIGTFAGFSALLIADALHRSGGGQVIAIDPEIPHENVMSPVDVARRVADRLGLGDHCRFVRGWGSTMIGLPSFEHWKHGVPVIGQSLLAELGTVDLVFIDADHSVTATIADFMLVKDFVAENGTVFFHDVFNWSPVTEALEIILNDIHYDRGAHELWQLDVNCGPDGLAALRRRPTPPSPALTVTVVDSTSGDALPGADVTAIGHATATTSTRGEVVFFRELPRNTRIDVVAPGYRRERTKLPEATDGRAITATVALHRAD
jgi:predicted O-methyltransferase YrrM